MESTQATAPPREANESALVARLRAGENGAYAELLAVYGPRLLATARRMMPVEEDAREAFQDAMLSAFKNISRFDENSKVSTWLHRIVVNACLMKLRSKRRRPETSIEPMLPAFLADGHQATPSVEWRNETALSLERRETRDLVRACIDRLPENYRIVLVLRDIEGVDTDEAATVLGMTANAVKTRLHRARQALRELLDPLIRSQQGADS
ncbi:MAG: sigma-70 family RNA polymerase sigma factor [Planctomycetes bacterium]|nr:sigma-70 family RNA polymerase sigma factor [Planctomycetota bacterium]